MTSGSGRAAQPGGKQNRMCRKYCWSFSVLRAVLFSCVAITAPDSSNMRITASCDRLKNSRGHSRS